jgi:hypothetical protein
MHCRLIVSEIFCMKPEKCVNSKNSPLLDHWGACVRGCTGLSEGHFLGGNEITQIPEYRLLCPSATAH